MYILGMGTVVEKRYLSSATAHFGAFFMVAHMESLSYWRVILVHEAHL